MSRSFRPRRCRSAIAVWMRPEAFLTLRFPKSHLQRVQWPSGPHVVRDLSADDHQESMTKAAYTQLA